MEERNMKWKERKREGRRVMKWSSMKGIEGTREGSRGVKRKKGGNRGNAKGKKERRKEKRSTGPPAKTATGIDAGEPKAANREAHSEEV
ncbi:hypothetical protein Scep_006789 [Stephania cephalantha]|uniref:Uncharacterized protein n=1 Tax=Stephania cephalantha TaxID=152367 RepID=A0AAP0K8T2_9MAGN